MPSSAGARGRRCQGAARRSAGASSVEYGLLLLLVSAVSLVGLGVAVHGVFDRAVGCISRAAPGYAADGAPECDAPGDGSVQPTRGGGPTPVPTGSATVQPTPCPSPSDTSSAPATGCATPSPTT